MQASTSHTKQPWQLQMFRRSLKKQQKLDVLLKLMGDAKGHKRLLISCGDNNGALNWYFRRHGGSWTWGDVEGENLAEMSQLLGEAVLHTPADRLPFNNDEFDCVVSIDVLEHLDNDQPFLLELRRVLRPNGRAIVTVPNGDPKLLANRIRWRLGMTPEVYGHTRAGYTEAELGASVEQAGFTPAGFDGYSRFFTEMMQLIINFGYVFVLSRKKGDASEGHIAPTSSGELKTHGAAYRLYSLIYPIMHLVSKLDCLLPARTNNAVIATAHKPETEAS
jgi:ubiquinone/menaquinone biosynthesis C-methylase UbiE